MMQYINSLFCTFNSCSYSCWIVGAIYQIQLHDLKFTTRAVYGKVSQPYPRYEGIYGEERYSSTHSKPRQQIEVSGLHHTPATLPLFKEASSDEPQSHSARFIEDKNFLTSSGFKPQIVQPVAQSLY